MTTSHLPFTQSQMSSVEMHRAFASADASFDGLFVAAIRTTGIFCLPSCPARKAKRENIEFFRNSEEALKAGYRPCQRCNPLLAHVAALPEWSTRLLSLAARSQSSRVTDADLRDRGIDPARARKWFKANYGMSFATYHRLLRLTSAQRGLRKGASSRTIGLQQGYSSTSGFRDAFRRHFGQGPDQPGQADIVVVTRMNTPIGTFIAGAVEAGICLFEFADRRSVELQVSTIQDQLKRPVLPGEHRYLTQLAKEVAEYFAHRRTRFDVPLSLHGTEFQKRVWSALLEIPYGRVCSYQALAKAIQHPTATRAVGRANGQNRIALLIPCHRVIGADGSLTGYGGGLWRKQLLLDHEQRGVQHAAGSIVE